MSGSTLPKPTERQVVIPAGRVLLVGSLDIPRDLRGLVIMAHGTGSTRFSPRNRAMAKELRLRGFGTVLVDLLIDREGTVRSTTFDIDLLAERFGYAVTWTAGEFDIDRLPLGFFGASTGAAAALLYAATGEHRPAAVVSRGGRPDLALPYLPQVTAPTLLIVGGADTAILDLNHAAQAHLSGLSKLFIVPGASHFFREPGAMTRVSAAAADWFETYLVHAVKARIELG